MGGTFTVGDAYTYVVASWAPLVGLDTAKRPHIEAYLARIAARPRVHEVLQREGLVH